MANPPPCPNVQAGACAKSDTYVEAEKPDAFVIRCKTCGGRNIWPLDTVEKRGRYEADLKRQLIQRQEQERFRRQKTYSLPGG